MEVSFFTAGVQSRAKQTARLRPYDVNWALFKQARGIWNQCHAQGKFSVPDHIWHFSNEVVYDVLSQGVSKLPEVEVKSSQKVPFY